MATMVVRRPTRRPAPELPGGELLLEAPPEIPEPTGRQWAQTLTMLPMVLMMAGMVLLYSTTTTGVGAIRYVFYGLFGGAMIVMLVVALITGGGPSRQQMGLARRGYLRHLSQQRLRVLRAAAAQRKALAYLHPDPDSLWSLAVSYRLWERRRDDPDFTVVRIGTGPQEPTTTLVPPDTQPLERLEPLSALALRRFLTTYKTIPDQPIAVPLTGFGRIYLPGHRGRSVAMVRALLIQLATFHAPDDLRIAVCAGERERADWEWLKWLPHALHPEKNDALGSLRLVASAVTAIEAMLDDLLSHRPRFDPESPTRASGPHVVVVLDSGTIAGADHLMTGSGVEGVTILDLTTAPPRVLDPSALVLDIDADRTLVGETLDEEIVLGVADGIDIPTAEGLARQLAPLRLTAGASGEAPMSADLGLAELLDLGDPFLFDPDTTWVQRPNRDRLRVKFGIRADGSPIELDLKESAQDGMGPHGLLIGATGSGKSELLRTLVLALAITHPPNSLNFALIDFKGGATFARMDTLPHTSAVVTNLVEELHLVDRMTDAINGELIRRQELLRAAGNFSSFRDYEKARAAGAPLAEVPTLLVIIDEFSELLTARPDFIDIFVQIGRVGRALGVHLLLASQRLEEGRLRGLEAHLSYRLCLRTFADMDSRVVLGVGDAFRLPRQPGHGFLKVGTEPMERFRSAYVSGVYRRRTAGAAVRGSGPTLELMDYGTSYRAPAIEEEEAAAPTRQADDDEIGESLMDILVDRLTGRGVPAHLVWLPPLGESPGLDGVLPPLTVDAVRGLTVTDAGLAGSLRTVAGIVDRPLEQRRDPLLLDLSGAAGHVAVVGGPQTGKSTTLASIICGLALTHTPREVQIYCLDFGGGVLGPLRDLPQVGIVAGRHDVDAVRRTIAEVDGVLSWRERKFSQYKIDSVASYRRMRAEGTLPPEADDGYGDVFLVVDGWLTIRNDFDDLEVVLADIATRGLAYGVHLMASCARWFDLRTNIRDLVGTKLELRLGDPTDSMLDRRTASVVPTDAPGRGVTVTKHHFQAAMPRLDAVPRTAPDSSEPSIEAILGSGQASAAGLEPGPAGLPGLVAAVREAWHGEPAPAVRLLPTEVPYEHLNGLSSAETGFAVGIAESDLSPVFLNLAEDTHFLLLGDIETGKSSFLRTVAGRIVETYSSDQARIVMVDYRHSLLGTVTTDHLIGYGTNPAVAASVIEQVARAMRERLPGEDITPEQLRTRSWWHGPEVYVLVDDYDMVCTSAEHPLAPLFPFLAQGAEIGLHIVMTRRTGGAGRGLFEPFIGRLRDVGAPGLMLSGDRSEGPLLGGIRPTAMPAGRGRLIDRRGTVRLVQLTWRPPAE
ncbi:type VII secretion protein EccCa [Actinomycetes bacterium KLBMP 9797]